MVSVSSDRSLYTLKAMAACLIAAELDEGHPHHSAIVEYHEENLALAARDLVLSIEALPPRERPIGWNTD